MTLASGMRLGPYEVLSSLGAGGMGEVYRARDPRLARDVAIKVLPEEFFDDDERRQRFEREARALAALNHPGIAAIHSFEEIPGSSSSRHILVMELVEGEDLAQRLAYGPLPLDEFLSYARQIAEALEAAHEKGIVHRDLKPANVKVTPDGRIKLLDFGLAKIFEGDGGPGSSPSVTHSPTLTARATAAGVILGTAAYMSPEQARGKPLDKRTDVWAFGCVLYEMLTGKRAFEGETVSDTLAAILTKDPDWSALPAETPGKTRDLLRRCLRRDAKQRLHDIADARLDIEELASVSASGTSPFEEKTPVPNPTAGRSAPAASARGSRRSLFLPWAIAAAFAAAAGALALSARAPQRVPATPVHSIVPLPAGTRLSGWASPVLALSRDGRKLAFVAEKDSGPQQLYVQHLDRDEVQLVPGSETAEGPVFSPDGKWVAFAVDVSPGASGAGRIGAIGQLRKFSLSTGLTQEICGIPDYIGGTWAADGSIFFIGEQPVPLSKVSAEGGQPALVAEKVRVGPTEGPRDLAWPQILPGGRAVLVTDGDASLWGHAAVLDLRSRELSDLGVESIFSRFAPTGHLLHLRPDGTLLATRFDLSGRRTIGAPIAVLKNVTISGNLGGAFAVSDNGVLAYASGYLRGSGRELQSLVRISRKGGIEPLPVETDAFGRYASASPDGRRIAVATWDGSLWVFDLARRSRSRVSTGKTSGADFLVWTPDGDGLYFCASREGEMGQTIFRQRVDAIGEPEALVSGGTEKHPLAVTPDGKTLLYMSFGGPSERGLWSLPLTQKGSASRILDLQVFNAALSPDGRTLAFDVGGRGGEEVYLQAFPELGRRIQISSGGGRNPRWSRDGREVFFRKDDGFFSARIKPGRELNAAPSELLFKSPDVRGYDVATDRDGFVAVFRPPDSGIIRELHLVTGWFDELISLAGGTR